MTPLRVICLFTSDVPIDTLNYLTIAIHCEIQFYPKTDDRFSSENFSILKFISLNIKYCARLLYFVFFWSFFIKLRLKMGVRGLMSYLEKENRKKQVNVSDEIRMWIA